MAHLFIRGLILLLGGIVCSHLFAQIPQEPQKPVRCKTAWQNDYRLLEVEYYSSGLLPCATFYENNGVRKRIAWAENTPGHCEQVARKVIKNLEEAGFHCEVSGDNQAHQRKSQADALPAPPTSSNEVDLFVNTVIALAERGDSYFIRVLDILWRSDREVYPDSGIRNINDYKKEWEKLRRVVDIGVDITTWILESPTCYRTSCESIMFKVEDEGALSLIGVLDGRFERVVDCVTRNGERRCSPAGKVFPLVRSENYQEAQSRTLTLDYFENGQYVPKVRCKELALNGNGWNWSLTYEGHSEPFNSGKSTKEYCEQFVDQFVWEQLAK